MSETSDEVSECPECGSTEFETFPETDSDEKACANCGYVIGSRKDIGEEFTPFKTSSAGEIQNEQTSDSGPADQTGWSRWYPCTECGSTTFRQRETVTVHGDEDGVYQGDDADFQQRIECDECGAVLLSE